MFHWKTEPCLPLFDRVNQNFYNLLTTSVWLVLIRTRILRKIQHKINIMSNR